MACAAVGRAEAWFWLLLASLSWSHTEIIWWSTCACHDAVILMWLWRQLLLLLTHHQLSFNWFVLILYSYMCAVFLIVKSHFFHQINCCGNFLIFELLKFHGMYWLILWSQNFVIRLNHPTTRFTWIWCIFSTLCKKSWLNMASLACFVVMCNQIKVIKYLMDNCPLAKWFLSSSFILLQIIHQDFSLSQIAHILILCGVCYMSLIRLNASCYSTYAGPAEVDNDWSGRTSGFYGRYFQKEAQKDYRVSSGVLLKIELGIR